MRYIFSKFAVLFAYFACVFFLSNWSSAAINPDECIGAWLFDEDGAATAEDIFRKGINGTVKGNPKWSEGKFGLALDCDGIDDEVDFGDNDSLDMGTSNFTIVAWVRVAKYTPPGWRDTVVGKMVTVAPRHGYAIGVRGALDTGGNADKPILMMGLGSDSGINCWGLTPINDDAWHHVAMVVDRDKSIMLYRDGQLESETDITAYSNQNEDNTGSFGIGNGGGGNYLQGLIDEVGIFNVDLTADEVTKIMNRGLEWELGITAVSPSGKLAATWADIKHYNSGN